MLLSVFIDESDRLKLKRFNLSTERVWSGNVYFIFKAFNFIKRSLASSGLIVSFFSVVSIFLIGFFSIGNGRIISLLVLPTIDIVVVVVETRLGFIRGNVPFEVERIGKSFVVGRVDTRSTKT
jgi:hypothetical protein